MKWTGIVICLMAGARLQAGVLEFDAMLKEASIPAEENTVTTDYAFENKSGAAVRIRKYDAACSCMKVTVQGGKLEYQPGEKGVIRTVFDMGNFSGVVDKQVMLYLDDDPDEKPSVVLTTRVHIPVLVSPDPKTVKWILGEPAAEKVIRITMNHDKPIHIVRVSGTLDGIAHEIRTVKEGFLYDLALKPVDTSKPALAVFRIETDCSIEKHRNQQVFAVIRKEMK